jgi:hypothetical protein
MSHRHLIREPVLGPVAGWMTQRRDVPFAAAADSLSGA